MGRRHRGVVHGDDVAVLQRRSGAVTRQQRDVLLAERGLTVYLRCQIGGNVDSRLQRQHCCDTAVLAEVDRLDLADLGTAVGDDARWDTGRRSVASSTVTV